MSELQGPRIPGEERTGRRRPLGWIIGGLIALLLLALLIPFACQALGGGGAADSQGEGSEAQEKASTQEANDGRGGGGARDADGAKNAGAASSGEQAQGETAGGDGSQGSNETGAEVDGAATSTTEDDGKTPDQQGDARTGGDLPETGGISPAALLVVGTVLLLTGSSGLSAIVRRRSASRG